MLAAMMAHESFSKSGQSQQKSDSAHENIQSEMCGIIGKGQLRTGCSNLMLFRCDHAETTIIIMSLIG